MFRFLLFCLPVTLLPVTLLPAAPVRVLFIGNSYTYYHSMPRMVEELAQAAGQEVETRAFTRGGSTLLELELHAELRTLLNEKWDYIVLQEHSSFGLSSWNGELTINDPSYFLQGARLLALRTKASGAKVILYATWARKNHPEFQPYLDYGYHAAARELAAISPVTVAPVGRAWAAIRDLQAREQQSREPQPAIELFDPDGSHPSVNGSYLAACVIMRTIFARPCLGLPGTLRGNPLNSRGQREEGREIDLVNLKPDLTAILQHAADEAVTEPGTYPPGPTITYTNGHRPKPDEFAGRWKGRVFFYATPANFELELKADNDSCSGTFRLSAENNSWSNSRRTATCRLTDQGLTFTLTDPTGASTEHHALTFNGKDQFTAITTFDFRTGMHRLGGTYLARPDGARTSSKR